MNITLDATPAWILHESCRIRAISICDAEACGVQASAASRCPSAASGTANRTGGANPAVRWLPDVAALRAEIA